MRFLSLQNLAYFSLLSIAFLSLMACTPTTEVRGNLVNAKTLQELEAGKTDQRQALVLMGTPVSTSTFDEKTWYYIGQKTEQYGIFEAEVVERQVVALHFNDDGILESIERYDENDGLALDPSARQTPSSGRQFTVLQQLIGNIGRFNKQGLPAQE